MLFEFFMNFLNIEKNKMLRIFFSIFQVFFAFHAIFNIKKINKMVLKNKFREGVDNFFFRKTILSHFISRFMLF